MRKGIFEGLMSKRFGKVDEEIDFSKIDKDDIKKWDKKRCEMMLGKLDDELDRLSDKNPKKYDEFYKNIYTPLYKTITDRANEADK